MNTKAESTNLVVRIFESVDSLLRQVDDPKWWIGAIDERTWRRWRNGNSTPDPDNAVRVALNLWDSLHQSGRECIRSLALKKIVALAPQAEKAEWFKEPSESAGTKNKDQAQKPHGPDLASRRALFGDWFRTLAAQSQLAKNVSAHQADPLDLELEVLVAPTLKSPAAEFRPLGPDVLPVQGGQRLRLKIKTSHPAYLYAWWVTPASKVEPLYPWRPGQWERLEVKLEQAVKILELPWSQGGSRLYWPITSERGLETLIVLAREERMPDDMRLKLRQNLVKLPVPKAGLAMLPGPHEWRLGGSGLPGSRGLDLKARRLEDPVRERHGALESRLVGYDVGKCLSFLNAG